MPSAIVLLPPSGEAKALAGIYAFADVQTAALITAYNPFGEQADAEVNQCHQELLLTDVASRWDYLLAEGFDPGGNWIAEPSLFVLGISLDEALALGRKYNQHAILFAGRTHTKLHACHPDNKDKLL